MATLSAGSGVHVASMGEGSADRVHRIATLVGFGALAAISVASILFGGSRPVEATLTPPAPAAPIALAGEASAWVYWTAPQAGITSYTLQASPGGATLTVSGSTLAADFGGLTDGTTYTFTVTATAGGASGPASAPSDGVVPGLGAYQPLTPARILDTRPSSSLGSGAIRNVQVAGLGGVPATGVSAVVLNATVTDTTTAGFITIWPAGVPRPSTSNLNWAAGKTVANLVEIALGTGGAVSVFNGPGSADVVLDVEGYVENPTVSLPLAGVYTPMLVPTRVLDTRIGLGSGKAQLCAGQTITVTIAGRGGVPASGVGAVVINVTATNTVVAPSAWTVYPAGASRPLASNLNFVPGQTVANRVIVKLGSGGAISFYNFYGHADVVADVNGWFTDGSVVMGGDRFSGVMPARVLDTRTTAPLGHLVPLVLNVAGQGGVPAMSAGVPPTAVVLNVTVTDPTAASYLVAWPAGATRPGTSDLNYVPGLTIANLVVVKVGLAGSIDLFNGAGSADVVVDVVGWYG